MQDIHTLSAEFSINAEKKKFGNFPIFMDRVKGNRILLLADKMTERFACGIEGLLKWNGNDCDLYVYGEDEPVADEKAVLDAVKNSSRADYILAVGSGTLNDIAKYSAFMTGKKCGVLATAPSMDGYSSKVTPLIENGFKITKNAKAADDILIDYDLLGTAPIKMIGAGVGDILAKFCSLTDWKLSSVLFKEKYDLRPAELMRSSLEEVYFSRDKILKGDKEGLSALMNALLVSGYAMIMAGSSRPASGAEHHMSHYLEMDFLRRGKKIPLHGIKVGLGTMVSLFLYHNLYRFDFPGKEEALPLSADLPAEEEIKGILSSFSCPVKFSDIDVSKDTVKNMLYEAYKIRDRFTVMTLYNKYGIMNLVSDEIIDKYY